MAILDSKSDLARQSQSSSNNGDTVGSSASQPSNEQQPFLQGTTSQNRYSNDVEALPSYEQHQPPPPPSQQPVWSQQPNSRQPSTHKRALKIACLSFIVFSVLYLLFAVGSSSHSIGSGGGSDSGRDGTPVVPPSDGKPVHDGDNWSSPHKLPHPDYPHDWPSSSLETYQSTTDFDVPLSSADALFLHAFGSNYQGSLTIETDASLSKGNSHARFVATYHDQALLEKVTIKQLTKEKSQGVGIYGLDHWHPRGEEDRLQIDVTWTFPESVTLPPLETSLHTLSTTYKPRDLTLTSWEHTSKAGSLHLGNLTSKDYVIIANDAGSVNVLAQSAQIDVPRLEIETNAGSVHLADVNAPRAIRIATDAGSVGTSKKSARWVSLNVAIETNAGSVHHTGTIEPPFEASRSTIDVKTHAGSIQGETFRVYDTLSLHTSTGSINANVALLQPASLGKDARHPVTVTAESGAGSVHLDYIEQTSQIDLHSSARSNAGSARVLHHATYLGTFDLKSSVGSIKYKLPDRSDAQKRSWKIDYEKKPSWGGGGQVKGAIFERGSDGNASRGSSDISADIGSVTVQF